LSSHSWRFPSAPVSQQCLPYGDGLLKLIRITQEYYQFFLSFGILGGVASACVWTTSLATTGHWFFHNRGIAIGVVTCAGPVGGIVFPLLFENLERKIGFGWTIRGIALICLVVGILAIALMRTRLPSSNYIKWNANFSILTDVRFVLTIFAMFFIDFACLIPAAYITPYAISQGMDSRMAYRLLAIMNAAQVPGRMIPGWLADHVGRFNVMVLSSLPCAMVILLLWLYATSTGTMIAFSVLFGLLSGTANSLTPVCISQLCRTEDYGSKYGTAYLFLSPATLIGIPVAGAVLDSDGKGSNFRGLILLCGFTYLASSVFFILARIAGAGLKVRKVF